MGLALTATGTSACVSMIAAWERGGQLAERLVWVGIGMVLLLSAHLLPALARSVSVALRIPTLVLWLCAMLATGYGHATFFISAQHHAGEIRAAGLDAQMPPAMATTGSSADPASIAAERAKVIAELATTRTQKCVDRCKALSLRRVLLSARLDALNVAFEEARRLEQSTDRLNAVRDRLAVSRAEALTDPVTARVSQMLGTSPGNIDLAVAIAFGAMLEFVACLSWLLALQEDQGSNQPVATTSNAMVAKGNGAGRDSSDRIDAPNDAGLPSPAGATARQATVAARSNDNLPPQTRDQKVTMLVARTVSADLARLAEEIAAGRNRGTVVEIRKLFRCSQAKAMALRRQLAEATREEPYAA